MKCPVCDSELNTSRCSCGYDVSRDYERYPTFGPVPTTASASGLRRRLAPKDALQCKKCGGTAFTIRIPDGIRLCRSCGWSPDELPRLACSCGNRYFSVRLEDGALMCPLCSRELPLEQFLERVRKIPKEAVKTVVSPRHVPTAKPFYTSVNFAQLNVSGSSPAKAALPASQPVAAGKKKKSSTDITAIAAGLGHTVALYADGTVGAVGDNSDHQCKVSGWKNIIAIAAGQAHTVGLKKDGTVVATGRNDKKQCAVQLWSDVIAIAAGNDFTVGLRRDGKVLIAGSNFGLQQRLTDAEPVAAITAGPDYIVALKKDGTAASSNNILTQADGWHNISILAAGQNHIVGLRENGSLVAGGSNIFRKHDVEKWTGILSVAVGHYHTVGLRMDGTVVATGNNSDHQCDVTRWRDIAAISAGYCHTVGLKTDGTLVATGNNQYGQCHVEGLMKR